MLYQTFYIRAIVLLHWSVKFERFHVWYVRFFYLSRTHRLHVFRIKRSIAILMRAFIIGEQRGGGWFASPRKLLSILFIALSPLKNVGRVAQWVKVLHLESEACPLKLHWALRWANGPKLATRMPMT